MVQRLSRFFLAPVTNIVIGMFLVYGFISAGRTISETFFVADISSLNDLEPLPRDYFLQLYMRGELPNKNKLHCYVDYYDRLIRLFPRLGEAYGLLGYCYHYLGHDARAEQDLKKAIAYYPDYFWNYYNLAAIEIRQARYHEAADILQKALALNPMLSVRRMTASTLGYMPLLGENQHKAFAYVTEHFREARRSCFVLYNILVHVDESPQARAFIEKLRPELYVF